MRGCAPWCCGEIDQLRRLADSANCRFLNRVALANERDDAAIVVGIHLAVEQIDAGNLHGFDNGVDLGRIAAFGKIGNAFNQRVGHVIEHNDQPREAATTIDVSSGKSQGFTVAAQLHALRQIRAFPSMTCRGVDHRF